MNPEDFSTLIEMLAYRAETTAHKPAFTYDGKAINFADLWAGVNRFAAFLLESGLQAGDRVVVALPNSHEFFPGFYGIQRAGGIAVPIFPGAGIERILSLAVICGAQKIIIPSHLPAADQNPIKGMVSQRGFSLITVKESEGLPPKANYPEVKPNEISFIQYTSGSTGNPKGVMLTHDNLLTNIRQMIAGMEITPDDIFVSWLPVYHDMGLILKTMVPFYLAAEVYLLPTNLRDVSPWLHAIQETRGTFTAAPDFAYRLCLRNVNPKDFNLTTLRVALNAAEPVRSSTIRDFERVYGLKNVMVAGYGLAEATVGVSMWKPETTNRVDESGKVSVGAPFPGVQVRIQEDYRILPPGKVGEITIKSEANSLGYFNNLEETSQLFTEDHYLLSGDLGYIDEDGYLYIVSRKKNIIKRGGETIAPQEIEELMDGVPSVRFSAAVGIDVGGIQGEQVYVFAEIRGGETLPEEDLHNIGIDLVSTFHTHMGFNPGRVMLLKPRSIPLTHNGKIKHLHLKEIYLDGSLRLQGNILYPTF